jgi:hypothetical protein
MQLSSLLLNGVCSPSFLFMFILNERENRAADYSQTLARATIAS